MWSSDTYRLQSSTPSPKIKVVEKVWSTIANPSKSKSIRVKSIYDRWYKSRQYKDTIIIKQSPTTSSHLKLQHPQAHAWFPRQHSFKLTQDSHRSQHHPRPILYLDDDLSFKPLVMQNWPAIGQAITFKWPACKEQIHEHVIPNHIWPYALTKWVNVYKALFM